MPENLSSSGDSASHPRWSEARPEKLPEPTVWPATLALGVALLLWGVVTSWLVGLAGLVLFALALAGWIGDIRHERKE